MSQDAQLRELLESSILPALLSVLDATGKISIQGKTQHIEQLKAIEASMIPTEWKTMLLNVDKALKQDRELVSTINKLIEVVSPISDNLSGLVNATNQLVALQKEQNKKLDAVLDGFIENTSRMEVLTTAVEGQTKDKALGDTFERIKEQTG